MRTLFRWALLAALATTATGVLAQVDGIPAQAYQTTNIRSGPDTRFDITGQLEADDAVAITGRDVTGRWLLIQTTTSVTGWVPAYALIFSGDLAQVPVVDGDDPALQQGDVWVTAYGRINVRAAPGITADIVAQMDLGDTAQAFARCCPTNDWLYIEFDPAAVDAADATPEPGRDAVSGWVAYFTVDVTGNVNALPVLTAAATADDALISPSELIQTSFNARLHPVPTVTSPTLIIVPFASTVQPLARSADSRWLYVAFDGIEGWGSRSLFDITDDAVAALPVVDPADVAAEAAA